jgi:hypothetical protein
MKKLAISLAAVLALSAGAALADADSQAGSAWNNNPNYGPVPGSAEYYGNSGWPPVQQVQPNPYANRYYAPQYNANPAYPYNRRNNYAARATPRDRDGDGVANRMDRYPDDPSRW